LALVRRIAIVTFHRIRSHVSKGGFKGIAGRLAFLASYVWIPVSYHFNIKAAPITRIAVLTFTTGMLMKALKTSAPEGLTYLPQNYLDRKYALSAKIENTFRMFEMPPSEIQAFREGVLQIIAQYVRDHRGDRKGRSIFANLLIEDGPDIVVLARDQEHRKPMVRCPRSEMIATSVFETGEIEAVGDLRKEFPHLPQKPYSSFMVVPIRLGTKIVGSVSIDSAERYRFDFEAGALAASLMPYIKLLAWTLTPKHVRDTLDEGANGGHHGP